MGADDRLAEVRVLGADADTGDSEAVTHSNALAEVARNHHNALLRYLQARTGSREEAREVAQEAYAKMLALDRPGTISFLEGYLWKIAGNLAINRRLQRNVRKRLDAIALFEVERFERSPEVLVDAGQRMALLERALGELTPRCLEAFVLRILDGLKFDEVAAEMRISARMAKMYVARALEHCQQSLNAAEGTPRKPR
jgi:RNA polymerase sigma factor (sigma-70 family)